MSSGLNEKILLGISRCLLGEKVRYDGGHKNNLFITKKLNHYFEWVSVCPEVEIGMGIPREPVRLVESDKSFKMVGTKSGTDWTTKMSSYSPQKSRELSKLNIRGFVFKKDSPSCGVFRVKTYRKNGYSGDKDTGLFAKAFIAENPLIPVEEEGRLNDMGLRENFIKRVFCYHRLQKINSRTKASEIVIFHQRHKYLFMSHSNKHYKKLGQLVAVVGKEKSKLWLENYKTLFMEALTYRATPAKHSNVLYHLLGHLKKYLKAETKESIITTLEDYRHGLVPLIVPITLLKHYVDEYDIDYLKSQHYLSPHPKELMLLNNA